MKNLVLCFFALLVFVCLVPAVRALPLPRADPAPQTVITVQNGRETQEFDPEEYTLRVLAACPGDISGAETAKALAVAVRSLALYTAKNGCKHASCDFCAEAGCCFALADPDSLPAEKRNAVLSAVNATKGVCLSQNGAPAPALFNVCSGAGTRDCPELPFNAATPRDPCEKHLCEVEIGPGALDSLGGAGGGNRCFVCENGYCEFAVIGNALVPAETLVSALHLPAFSFSVSESADGAVFSCRGVGHGYGLDLCFASVLESKGADWKAILKYYFPKADICG